MSVIIDENIIQNALNTFSNIKLVEKLSLKNSEKDVEIINLRFLTAIKKNEEEKLGLKLNLNNYNMIFNTNHKCKAKKCKMEYFKKNLKIYDITKNYDYILTSGDIYICNSSGNYHICNNEKCEYTVINETFTVCELTGNSKFDLFSRKPAYEKDDDGNVMYISQREINLIEKYEKDISLKLRLENEKLISNSNVIDENILRKSLELCDINIIGNFDPIESVNKMNIEELIYNLKIITEFKKSNSYLNMQRLYNIEKKQMMKILIQETEMINRFKKLKYENLEFNVKDFKMFETMKTREVKKFIKDYKMSKIVSYNDYDKKKNNSLLNGEQKQKKQPKKINQRNHLILKYENNINSAHEFFKLCTHVEYIKLYLSYKINKIKNNIIKSNIKFQNSISLLEYIMNKLDNKLTIIDNYNKLMKYEKILILRSMEFWIKIINSDYVKEKFQFQKKNKTFFIKYFSYIIYQLKKKDFIHDFSLTSKFVEKYNLRDYIVQNYDEKNIKNIDVTNFKICIIKKNNKLNFILHLKQLNKIFKKIPKENLKIQKNETLNKSSQLVINSICSIKKNFLNNIKNNLNNNNNEQDINKNLLIQNYIKNCFDLKFEL